MPLEPDSTRHFALLPAAGSGSRMRADRPKQYLSLAGRSVLEHAIAPFLAARWIEAVVVVVAPDDAIAAGMAGLRDPRIAIVAAGGATRRDSVLGGLRWLASERGAQPGDWIHVHDAARPGLDAATLERLKAALDAGAPGALLAVPVVDTVKRGDAGAVAGTVARDGLWLAQTPQSFRHGALSAALSRHASVTDEASAIEADGGRPALVAGSRRNFKVTTHEDLAMMRCLLAFDPLGEADPLSEAHRLGGADPLASRP
jgi:2-C-methyl-D-erythritol 4-phosphate cytidylyltransferase